jgi:ribosomal protein S6--L-glutamate ligase
MKALVVVNGERDWQPFLPGIEVHHRRLQTSRWLYHDGVLWVFDESGGLRVDGVLWRVGAIRPEPAYRAVLEMIRLAGVPCVNPAATLLRGYDRLSMLAELRATGLPLLPVTVALGERILDAMQPQMPAVVKIGNYHGGFGKARVADEAQWADMRDLAFVSQEYITIEPYIEYVRDVRCLAVGDEIWAMSRRGIFWKANTQTSSYELLEQPPVLADCTRRAMSHFAADVLTMDYLETADGAFVALESNDVPGFSGFPEAARVAVARRMRERLEA